VRNALSTSLWLVAIFVTFAAGTVQAAELIWQVESPFRFFKSTRSFAMHEAAYNTARGALNGPLPVDIVWRLERASTIRIARTPRRPIVARRPPARAMRKAASAGQRKRSATPATRSDGRPRRYAPVCERKYSWGSARKTTSCRKPTRCKSDRGRSARRRDRGLRLELAAAQAGRQDRGPRSWPARTKLTIARVPYALDRAVSGVAVTVKIAGRPRAVRS